MSPLRTSAMSMLEPGENRGIDTCTTCPKLCRWACPVAEAEARETTSPWNLVVMAGYTKKGLASVESTGRFAYHCSHCGACTEACLHKNDVPMLLTLARARALNGHAAPDGAIEVRGHFGVAGNPYGTALEPRLIEIVRAARHDPADLSRPVAAGSTLYFPGCSTIRDMPQAASSFLRALALRGIGGVVVNELSAACCGLPLFWAGDLDGFRSHAARFADRLSKVDRVLVHDPACAHAMLHRYRDVGVTLEPEVVHVAAFLATELGLLSPKGELEWGDDHIECATGPLPTPRGPAKGVTTRVPEPLAPGEAPRGVAYADCCTLARGLRLVSAPRRLIAKATGAPPKELPGLRGLEADCCGAGGLLPVTAPATANQMADARIQAFRKSGASRLVTFSPRCAAHLLKTDPSLDVVDGCTLLEHGSG